MSRELIQVIQQICRERQIDKDILIEAVESALLSAAKKKFGQNFRLLYLSIFQLHMTSSKKA